MKLTSKVTSANLNDYMSAVKRECALLDVVAALNKQPKSILRALTDHPQQTLDQYAAKYGVKLDASEDLPTATYLAILSRQGFDLTTLMAGLENSSAKLLAQFNESFHAEIRQSGSASHTHTVLFQSAPLTAETAQSGVSHGLNNKK